jgi:hypothetical protein
MEVCDVCGASFDTGGYSIWADGRRYDSIECALKAQASMRRKSDTMSLWIEAGRLRLGLYDPLPDEDSLKDRK